MTSAGATGLQSRNVVLAAMIFAVAMTFIDQTIVSIAAPNIQRELGLTNTGVQWAINAYLLALAALFAFGGRLADTVGHRRMVTIGVIVFAGASAMCGLTPKGAAARPGSWPFGPCRAWAAHHVPGRSRHRGPDLSSAPAWPGPGVVFRHCRRPHRGGPVLGGYLTEWTWRAIFWVNIPVALIALALIMVSRPVTDISRAPIDYRGLVAHRRRGVALDSRLPAVRPLGVGQPLDRGAHRGRRRPVGGFRPGGVAHRLTADAGANLPGQGLRRREPGARDQHAGLRPVVLLCQ